MVLNGIGLTQFAATELSLAEKGIASAKVALWWYSRFCSCSSA